MPKPTTPGAGRPIRGTNGNDAITGTYAGETIYGFGGYDIIHGGDGNDTIYGGLEGDLLYGDAGDDFLDGGGTDNHDNLYGGAGNDTMVRATRAVADGGFDLIDDVYVVQFSDVWTDGIVAVPNSSGGYDASSGGTPVAAIHDVYGAVPMLNGTSFSDTVTLAPGGQVDTGAGDDTIILPATAGALPGTIVGGAGTDTLVLGITTRFVGWSNTQSTLSSGGSQYASVDALPNPGQGIERLVGTSGNDEFYLGGSSVHTVDAGGGDDVLRQGWMTTNTFTGGAGADTFEIGLGDDVVITDFGVGADAIHLYYGRTVSWTSTDVNSDGKMDTVGAVSDGTTITLLGYDTTTPEAVVFSHSGAWQEYWL